MAYDRRGGWEQRKEIVSIFWHIYSSAAALFLSTGSRSFFFWFQFSQHPLSACCVWQWSFQEEGFNIPSPLTSTRCHPRAPQVCLQAKCIHCGCYANTVSNEPPVILPPHDSLKSLSDTLPLSFSPNIQQNFIIFKMKGNWGVTQFWVCSQCMPPLPPARKSGQRTTQHLGSFVPNLLEVKCQWTRLGLEKL